MDIDIPVSNFLREDLVEREGEELFEWEEEDNDDVTWDWDQGRAGLEGESSTLESVCWMGVCLRVLFIIGMSSPVYDGWVIIYDNLIDGSNLFKLSTSLLLSDLNIE